MARMVSSADTSALAISRSASVYTPDMAGMLRDLRTAPLLQYWYLVLYEIPVYTGTCTNGIIILGTPGKAEAQLLLQGPGSDPL